MPVMQVSSRANSVYCVRDDGGGEVGCGSEVAVKANVGGGVFVGGDPAGVGKDGAGLVVVVVGVIVNGAGGEVALLLFAGHEAEDGVGDLLLVELGLAALVEVAGGLAKLFVNQIVERLVNGNVTGAESVAVEGAGDPGPEGGALVDVGLEREPGVMAAGLGDFGIPLAGG